MRCAILNGKGEARRNARSRKGKILEREGKGVSITPFLLPNAEGRGTE